ncbi:hypothetical protein MN116_008134 [Schistosoma mekongi]|uniref:Golgi apparatus membrane protein TVP23 homolog n=1 Tax=Schistosoma mekongi TaxID=38744 RepID=A0AAE2D2V9_SCHME|nr:hypothetical protein MN116_008134 [Schistosoma mekongi]
MDSRDEVVLALTDNMDTEPSSSGPHSPSTRRLAIIGHFLFRSSALIIYLLCAWFTTSFVLPFIFILICLSLDFWVVKNISGRILVGLRWSSYTDEAGTVHWRYDARKPSPIDSADVSSLSRRELAARIVRQQLSRLFWIGLIASPALWCVFFLASIFSLHIRWAFVCSIALCMNVANVYGYIRCWMSNMDESASNLLTVIKSTASSKIFTNLWPSVKTKPNINNLSDSSSGLPLIA